MKLTEVIFRIHPDKSIHMSLPLLNLVSTEVDYKLTEDEVVRLRNLILDIKINHLKNEETTVIPSIDTQSSIG